MKVRYGRTVSSSTTCTRATDRWPSSTTDSPTHPGPIAIYSRLWPTPGTFFGENIVTYDQIKRSFYFWYFQIQRVAEDVIRADDFAFIDNIWADWSPGYDASEDLPRVKDCIREQEHLEAALGYYWGQFDPTRFGSPSWAAEQAAAWGYSLAQPTLYLHGTNDGCHDMSQAQVDRVPDYCGKGSHSELIEGVGHFMMVERPDDINRKILEFLREG